MFWVVGQPSEGGMWQTFARRTSLLSSAAFICSIAWGLILTTHAHAEDKSAFAPTKLTLPDGPGSITGVGENLEFEPHMGQASYAVKIEAPRGYESLPVAVGLRYSAGVGNGPLGLGWSLGVESIDRRTVKGTPSYDASDTFAANGGAELVEVEPGVFRQRYEGAFIRYSYDQVRDRWVAEYPDGTTGYFGSDISGASVGLARVQGTRGNTARYLLHEKTDRRGHVVRYEYTADGANRLLSSISYVFGDDATPRYQILFGYEARPDTQIDGRFGFSVPTTRRLRDVQVLVRGEQLRRYLLTYQDPVLGRSMSLLDSVTTYGRDNTEPYPVRFSFGYTGALPTACGNLQCQQMRLVTMNAPSLRQGMDNADLIDLNGDAVPDLLDTSSGQHQILIGQLRQGQHYFGAPEPTKLPGGGASQLSAATTTMIDFDGDQDADFLDLSNGRVLVNTLTGDWSEVRTVDTARLPRIDLDANLRFVDVDHDKQIDLLHAGPDGAYWYPSLGDGTFGEPIFAPTETSAAFTDGLRLADVNGDGIQDWVELVGGIARYREHRGHLELSEWRELPGAPAVITPTMQLVDLNGDGLVDLVDPSGRSVTVWLGQGERGFSVPLTITTVQGQLLPDATAAGTRVRVVDMNANGTTDIAYFPATGPVQYLEVFPSKPNLLERVDNAIGKVMELEYSTAALEMARDGGPEAWTYRLAMPIQVVSQMRTYDTLSRVQQIKRLQYRDGYYDGPEHQFRGFSGVELISTGDASVEPGRQSLVFDVGQTDRYRHGKQLVSEQYSGDRLIERTHSTYDECEVAEVSDELEPRVRHVCMTREVREVLEGLDEAEAVEITTETEYDGYGQVTLKRELGVTSIGGQGCTACDRGESVFGEPCGQMCLGDERYTRTTYIEPGAATSTYWIIGKPSVIETYGREGSDTVGVQRFYYDGPEFSGLPLGTLFRGELTRRTERSDETRFLSRERFQRGTHGEVVVALDPEGARTTYTHDADGILITRESLALESGGEDSSLDVLAEYDPVLELLTRRSNTLLLRQGERQNQRRDTRMGYDRFGRVVWQALPGDSAQRPTRVYEYDLADPLSRIVERSRTRVEGPLDAERVTCFDGFGRQTQRRLKVGSRRWLVEDHVVFGADGKATRLYQTHTTDNGICAARAPDGVRFVTNQRDVLGRTISEAMPDADLYGTASERRVEYRPQQTLSFDEEDTDTTSPFFNTPTIRQYDGLDRAIRTTRWLDESATTDVRLTYDELGRDRGYVLEGGIEKIQTFDLAGRLIAIDDPDRGALRFEYNDRDQLSLQVDARGKILAFSYDEAGRKIQEWEEGAREETLREMEYDDSDACTGSRCANAQGLLAAVRYRVAGQPALDVFRYNARGHLVGLVREIDGMRFEFAETLDNHDRVVRRDFPDGRVLRYEYDLVDRLTRVPGFVERIDYDAFGELELVERGNGVITRYERDGRTRLASIISTNGSNDLLQRYDYTRSRTGQVVQVQDQSLLEEGQPSLSARYEYDASYRLISASLEPGRSDHSERIQYEYDALDRMLSKRSSAGAESPVHVEQMMYGERGAGPHALTRADDVELDHDPAGNVTVLRGMELGWDAWGRLTHATRENRTLVENGYGWQPGRLLKREHGQTTYYPSDEYELRGGEATIWVKTGSHRIARWVDAAASATLFDDVAPRGMPDGVFTSGDALLQFGHESDRLELENPSTLKSSDMLGASAAMLLDTDATREGVITYLHQDHLGSTVLTTDAAGQVSERTTYYPYGHGREPVTEPYQYTGIERDSSTGFDAFALRHYSSQLSVWISPDPAFLLFSSNATQTREGFCPYSYASNDPVNLIDRLGGKHMPPDYGVTRPTPSETLKLGIKQVLEATSDLVATVTTTTIAAAATGGASLTIDTIGLSFRFTSTFAKFGAGITNMGAAAHDYRGRFEDADYARKGAKRIYQIGEDLGHIADGLNVFTAPFKIAKGAGNLWSSLKKNDPGQSFKNAKDLKGHVDEYQKGLDSTEKLIDRSSLGQPITPPNLPSPEQKVELP